MTRQTTLDRLWGLRRTLFSTFEDLDFADDLALVSRTQRYKQKIATRLSMFVQQVGLKKTEVTMLNVPNPTPVKVNGEDLRTTEEFVYLGSIVRHVSGAGSGIRNRVNKTRNVFRMLNNV